MGLRATLWVVRLRFMLTGCGVWLKPRVSVTLRVFKSFIEGMVSRASDFTSPSNRLSLCD